MYTAPKFFDGHASVPALPPIPATRNGGHGGRGGKPEFVMSATMSVHQGAYGADGRRNSVIRGWEAQGGPMLRRGRRMELDVGGYGISKSGAVGQPLGRAVQVGEDAYFIGRRGIGVADGVGGWRKGKGKEVDSSTESGSAAFSRGLMEGAAEECEMEPPRPSNFIGMLERRWDAYDELRELEDAIDVLVVLERAYANTKPVTQGSSTALVAVLSPTGATATLESTTLKIAHVGDCMAMLIRDHQLVFRSEEMWWAFNTPVQLSTHAAPDDVNPHTYAVPVREGDLVILATDGLSDNLWDEDIIDEVEKWDGSDVHVLSEALCSRARAVARDRTAHTPFAQRAQLEGKKFDGGKKDDISVVCALVQRIT